MVRFPREPALEADLHELVRAESECCPFLSMRLEPGSAFVDLDVSGLPDARPLIDEMFA